MNRTELIWLLGDAESGYVILIEQVDRLTRLDDAGWETLRKQITDKQLAIVSLDLPTSHLALSSTISDDFTRSMLKAVNSMMLDMLAAIARNVRILAIPPTTDAKSAFGQVSFFHYAVC